MFLFVFEVVLFCFFFSFFFGPKTPLKLIRGLNDLIKESSLLLFVNKFKLVFKLLEVSKVKVHLLKFTLLSMIYLLFLLNIVLLSVILSREDNEVSEYDFSFSSSSSFNVA